MKLLVLGNDGRTHAFVAKLLNGRQPPDIVCAAGNGGTAPLVATADIDEADARGVGRWAFDELFDLILPTSSRPLRAGLVEEALSLQIGICGAPQRAAQLEQSRCAAKEFMLRHQLPTAPGRTFTNRETAEKYLASRPLPLMIKADHPEIGEEAFSDRYTALEGLRRLLTTQPVEGSSNGVVIEEVLTGPRVVLSAFADGHTAVPLLATRLYDRVEDGDQGLQAAGVGAHTSNSNYAQQLTKYLHEKFILPIVAGLARDSIPFWGMLSIDCIITAAGPRLTAIRCAMHQGEAEVVLPRMADDLLPWIEAMIARRLLEMQPPSWTPTPSVGIGVMARGYPTFFPYGGAIGGLADIDEGVLVLHNTTASPAAVLPYTPRINRGGALGSVLGGLFGMGGGPGGILHTTGGQPLTVVTQAATLAGARGRALINAERIQFEGRSFRSDIGAKEFG